MFLEHVTAIDVEVLGVMTSCSVGVGYQRLGGPRCLRLQGEMNGTGKSYI